MEETLSTLKTLMKQQQSYQKCDYLATIDCHSVDDVSYTGEGEFVSVIDRECRSKMVEWCYQVVRFFNLPCDDIVEIAMSYADRFLMTSTGRRLAMVSQATYQLVCMTCLYTAVKIHEQTAMDLKLVVALSHGAYTEIEIEQMELTILTALKWRVNPPTTSSFVRLLVRLVPTDHLYMVGKASNIVSEKRQILYDRTVSHIFDKSYILDYDMAIKVEPSEMALLALMDVLSEYEGELPIYKDASLKKFETEMSKIVRRNHEACVLADIDIGQQPEQQVQPQQQKQLQGQERISFTSKLSRSKSPVDVKNILMEAALK